MVHLKQTALNLENPASWFCSCRSPQILTVKLNLFYVNFIIECDSNKNICDGISKHAHFHNFGMAFLTLFRIFTGDNWNGIMKVEKYKNYLIMYNIFKIY